MTPTTAPATAGLTLAAIGLRHGTDKAAHGHGYLDFYERFFGPLRHQPVSLLEIGVFEGRSLRMWAEYFANGRIVGVDVDPEATQHAETRIIIEIADQSDVAQLVRLGIAYGPFDIVLDDGSHFWEHQITTLRYLYPFVKAGGFFVVEDVNTSYGDGIAHFKGKADVSAAQYLHRLTDLLVGDVEQDLAAEGDAFLRSCARETEFVAFHRHTALLRRRPGPRAPSWQPLMEWQPAAAGAPAGRLLAHVSNRGDVTNPVALHGGERWSGRAIQGFAIDVAAPAGALEYRALRQGLAWTEWRAQGSFVGTRGKSELLHGFAVRLRGELGQRFECIYAGAFVGVAEPVVARDGADCRSFGGEPLEAMEVVLRPRPAAP